MITNDLTTVLVGSESCLFHKCTRWSISVCGLYSFYPICDKSWKQCPPNLIGQTDLPINVKHAVFRELTYRYNLQQEHVLQNWLEGGCINCWLFMREWKDHEEWKWVEEWGRGCVYGDMNQVSMTWGKALSKAPSSFLRCLNASDTWTLCAAIIFHNTFYS